MDSILTSIKKMLGITEEYTQFDQDLIIHINTVLSILTQMGIGPSSGFIITNSNQKWNDWFTITNDMNLIKTYVYLRVKMLFDPPTIATVVKSNEESIREIGCRLFMLTDLPLVIEEEVIE